MEERENTEAKNETRYNKFRKSKDLLNECKEIESLEQKHDIFNLYKKIKDVTEANTSSSNKLQYESERILDACKKYMRGLFEKVQKT